MLEHGQPDAGRPLGQGVKGAEMKEITVLTGRGHAQHVLERPSIVGLNRERFDLDFEGGRGKKKTCPSAIWIMLGGVE